MDDLDDFTLWTSTSAAGVVEAGSRLTAAIDHQVSLLTHDALPPTWEDQIAAGNSVQAAAIEFANAQFAHSGYSGPLGALIPWEEDDEFEESEPHPVTHLSVIRRIDYGVIDEAAVIDLAQSKYLKTWPDDSADDAESRISGLGIALYEIAHAEGWDFLAKVPGLIEEGAITQVLETLERLEFADDGDTVANAAFDVDGEVLFTHRDIYG